MTYVSAGFLEPEVMADAGRNRVTITPGFGVALCDPWYLVAPQAFPLTRRLYRDLSSRNIFLRSNYCARNNRARQERIASANHVNKKNEVASTNIVGVIATFGQSRFTQ